MIYSYRRVSTEEQANGPLAQYDTINRWFLASGMPYHVESQDFFDNGVSGSVPLAERPAGKLLMARIEQDESPPTILVAKLDRMFRSVADAAVTLAHWDKVGVKLVSIGEGFDMTNPYGRAMAQMASVFAELERALIRSRTSAAIQAKIARGDHHGGVPYGWDRIKGKLKINQAEQSVLAKIRDWSGLGLKQEYIAGKLNAAGVTTKKGTVWDQQSVSKALATEEKFRIIGVPNINPEAENELIAAGNTD